MEATTYTVGCGVDYFNNPLPNIGGKSDEVGLKTSYLDGRISGTFALYNMLLTNQTVQAPYNSVNVAGYPYSIPSGSTRSKGWDGSIALQLLPGWQLIGSGNVGTVRDQNNNPFPNTYETEWSFFTRYDFPAATALRGLSLGGGASRDGGRWWDISDMILPSGHTPALNSSGFHPIKLYQGTMASLFAAYQFNKHFGITVTCENVLNSAYAVGLQDVGIVDPSDPTTTTVQMTYKF
jgi:outer-membrane receptor for ferric coprogen and ferric-rhodotorulic acid